MALVTVQRSPSPSNSPESLGSDLGEPDEVDESGQRTPVRSRRSESSRKRLKKVFSTIRFISRLRFSESYLAVKGAALILPQSECARTITKGATGEIQSHLQYMFYLLRPQDTIKVAVKLESSSEEWNRYLAVVSTSGRQDTEESMILGIDIVGETATVGMVLPIWSDMKIRLDGDGGFSVTTVERHHVFKPVSVQAMWSALQTLIKVRDIAQQNSYHASGLTHTWVTYYDVRVKSAQNAVNEWHVMEDIESHRADFKESSSDKAKDKEQLEKFIRTKLKEIMMTVDLEEVTSKFLRTKVEEQLGRDLRDYRSFIDEEMIIILRQMDAPSEILDYLYLGSEWNASNLEELRENGVGAILNVTREIDNFFPGMFDYFNVRLYDEEKSELLKFWDNTYKFIKAAKENHSKVLVHCKMGVSRSASTVIAYAMKEYGWSLEQAHKHVKSRRSCIKPNSGFMKQLITYQGILDASKQRHNKLWRSASAGNLEEGQVREVQEELCEEVRDLLQDAPSDGRPRSWSPEDSAAQLMMKAQDLGTESESSVEDGQVPSPPPAILGSDKAPLSPFLFTIENWEELDLSSRSADSLDDILDDTPSAHKTCIRSADLNSDNVVLLSKKLLPFDQTTESHQEAEPESSHDEEQTLDRLGSGSEVDDFMDEDATVRPRRGCYDMCMLTGHHTLLSTPDGSEDEGEDPPDGIFIWYLHPDTKLETIQSQFRKQRRIAQLLCLSDRKEEEERVKIVQAERTRQRKAKVVRTNSSPLLPTKVKPDDFWIKEPAASDDPGDEGIEVSNPEGASEIVAVKPASVEVAETEAAKDESPSPAPAEEKPTVDIPRATDVNESTCKPIATGNQGMNTAFQSDTIQLSQNMDPSLPQTEDEVACVDGECPDTPQREIGIWQHYEKEDIPWSPGTVKRQTLDIEEKLKTSTDSERRESVSSDDSTDYPGDVMHQSCDSQQDGGCSVVETTRDEQSQDPSSKSFKADSNSLKSHSTGQMSDTKLGVDTWIDSSEKNATEGISLSSDQGSPPRHSLSDGAVSPLDGGNREPNVYDDEEIDLEPGLVQRTKMEFEQRERSSSSAELEGLTDEDTRDGRPVQRSSSWKIEKVTKSKNRDSDRRKTCLPVLQFSPLTLRDGSVQRGASSATVETPETITIVKVGTEDVEVNEGQVKRRTKDFEMLTAEERQLLDVLDQNPRPRSRSHSPYVDECLSIPSGSVKQQKQQLQSHVIQEPGNGENTKGQVDDQTTTHSDHTDLLRDFGTAVECAKASSMTASEDSSDTKSEVAADAATVEGVTTDSSTDEDKYEAIRTESTPTLLMEGVADGGPSSFAGIVKHHKQAIESKAKESGVCIIRKCGDEEQYVMGPELLTVIRRVGRALSVTAKDDTDTEEPSKRVKQVAKEIENKLGTKSDRFFAKRNLHLSKGAASLARSASLREKPVSSGVTVSQVGRSSSLRESVSSEKEFLSDVEVLQQKPVMSPQSPTEICTFVTNTREMDTCAMEPAETNLKGEDCQNDDSAESRKIVKDLVGIFEPRPGDPKDQSCSPQSILTSPDSGMSAKSKSPKNSLSKGSKCPEVQRMRSSSATLPSDSKTKTSRIRTKSENFGARSKTLKTATSREKLTKTHARTSSNELGAPALKGSRDTSPKTLGTGARSKSKSPSPRREESKSRLSPAGTKRAESPRTSPSQYKKDGVRSKTSPTACRLRSDSKGENDEPGKRSSTGGRLSPRVDIKAASAHGAKEASKRSPKSTSPSPSPPGAGNVSKTSPGGRSPVSRNLFSGGTAGSTASKGQKPRATDRKGSLSLPSEKDTAAQGARPRTRSYTSGSDQSQGITQVPQTRISARPTNIGSSQDNVTSTSSESRANVTPSTTTPSDSTSNMAVISPITGKPFVPLSRQTEDIDDGKPKVRKPHGKSHPLAKLASKKPDSRSDHYSKS